MTSFESNVLAIRGDGLFFSSDRPLCISRAPGRLDLMGGNVDYTEGTVFQATIREATWAAVQSRSDSSIVFWNPQLAREGWLDRVEFSFSQLSNEGAVRSLTNSNPAMRWTSYVLGAFYLLRCRYPERVSAGANVYIESSVPLNKGVSSSAAVEVAVLKAAAAVYGLDLKGIELAEACQWVIAMLGD